MNWAEIKRLNKTLKENLKGPEKEIAVISNITINSLKEILELVLRKEKINVTIKLGDFDSLMRDSIKFSTSDAVIIFWEIANLIPGLSENFSSLSKEKQNEIVDQKKLEIKEVLENLEKTPLVLFNKFSSHKYSNDPVCYDKASFISNLLNKELEIVKKNNTFLIDLNKIFHTAENAINERQYALTSELYTNLFYIKYSDSIKHFFMSLYGRTKKVLIMDCDNSLWGGILGEDGENEIAIGRDSVKGKIYLKVQKIIKKFVSEGTLLALCSKNNSKDVDEVLRKNKNMIIKDEDIIIKKVNWKDKASNIQEISKELNLSTDSFIFVDDSKFEIGLINKEFPEIKTILVPENLEDYPSLMQNLEKDFFRLSSTSEDKIRTQLYSEEDERKKTKKSFENLKDYLRSLNLKLKIHKGREVSVPRAAQMSQRTNQFNLTTKRYSEEDIKKFIQDDSAGIFTFELSDKFGDYGITGMSICKIEGSEAEIDTFLLSCRVIGRDIEYVFLEKIIEDLIKKGIKKVKGFYFETLKNHQVKNFFSEMGFEEDSNKESFILHTNQFRSRNINYVKVI